MQNMKNNGTEKLNEQVSHNEKEVHNSVQNIVMCGGDGCTSLGGQLVRKRLEKEIKENGYDGKIEIQERGCHSLCFSGPIVTAGPKNTTYKDVSEDDVPKIIENTIKS